MRACTLALGTDEGNGRRLLVNAPRIDVSAPFLLRTVRCPRKGADTAILRASRVCVSAMCKCLCKECVVSVLVV